MKHLSQVGKHKHMSKNEALAEILESCTVYITHGILYFKQANRILDVITLWFVV